MIRRYAEWVVFWFMNAWMCVSLVPYALLPACVWYVVHEIYKDGGEG